jgi:hypothetical protein
MHYNQRIMTPVLPAYLPDRPTAPNRWAKSAKCAQNHNARKKREIGAKQPPNNRETSAKQARNNRAKSAKNLSQ